MVSLWAATSCRNCPDLLFLPFDFRRSYQRTDTLHDVGTHLRRRTFSFSVFSSPFTAFNSCSVAFNSAVLCSRMAFACS